MRTKPLLFALLMCVSVTVAAEPSATKKLPAIHDAMQAAVDQNLVAGVVTLVGDQQGAIQIDTAGKADIAKDQPMQPDAICWIASMSKPVTATALMILQDEKKLTVDDPVSKFIPEFAALKTPAGKPANLTIRHLMTHTSGLAEAPPEVVKQSTKLAELVPSYLAKPTAFEPGSEWRYCQSGINTASRIVEIASGMSFPDFMQKRIFEPLGMKDTTFYLTEAQLPRLAKSYAMKDGKLEQADIYFLQGKSPTDHQRPPMGNGGLFSTAEDYGKFCRMLLCKGTVDGKTIISPEAYAVMTKVQSGDVKTGFTPGNAWGIGVCIVREPQGVSAMLSPGTFGHGGAYGTQAWIDPVKGRYYVLMVQRSNFKNSDASEVRQAFQEAATK